MYGGLTCGTCKACREGRDNLCENVAGIMGFHVDGFARDLLNMPARLVIPVPEGVADRDAACAPIAFATVEHMLFDNAKLQPGETILVQAGGSGIGTVAIKMAKALGCTVITTVGDDAKAEKAKALGADHVINYKTQRFETITRKLTNKKGVDVVFEHVGGEGFNGSLLVLKRGGRLVTCGSTAGPSDPVQPDAALPAAVQNLRLVRRDHGKHPRQPRQNGGGHDARHRSGSAAGRVRARPGAARKPPGVRQSRCHLLTWRPGRNPWEAGREAAWMPWSGPAREACCAWRGASTARKPPMGPARCCARSGPGFRSIGSAGATCAWHFRKNRTRRSSASSLAFGTISAASSTDFAHLDRLQVYDPAVPGPGDIEYSPQALARFEQLRDSKQPVIMFAAHLANWELPALVAHRYGVDAVVLYRRPNLGGVADAAIAIRAGAMGTLIPTTRFAPVTLGNALESGRHVGMLVDQYYTRGVPITFFGQPTRANPLLARLVRQFKCPIHGTRIIRLPGNRFRADMTGPIAPALDARWRYRHRRHHAGRARRDRGLDPRISRAVALDSPPLAAGRQEPEVQARGVGAERLSQVLVGRPAAFHAMMPPARWLS